MKNRRIEEEFMEEKADKYKNILLCKMGKDSANLEIGYVSAILLFAAWTAFVASEQCYESDLSFLISTGRYIVEKGIPYTNPFTIIEGLKIIVQQWMWDVIVFWVYDAMGKVGLYFVILISVAIMMALLYKLTILLGMGRKVSLFAAALFITINIMFITARPTSATLILLIWQIYVLEKYKRDGKKGRLFCLIVISALEANLHSALWIIHFVFLLPYIVPPIKNPFVSFEKYHYKTRLPILAVVPLMVVAGMLNPYGIDGILYLFYSYGDQLNQANIPELDPVNVLDINGIRVPVGLLMLMAVLMDKKEKDSDLFYLTCGTFILGMQCKRNLVYFPFGMYILAVWLVKKIDMNRVRLFFLKKNKGYMMSVLCGTICAVLILFYQAVCQLQTPFEDRFRSPFLALTYIEENYTAPREECRIYTQFGSGAFFELNGYKCYVDERPELFFEKINGKGEFFLESQECTFSTDPEFFENFIKKYNFQYYLTSKGSTFAMFLNGNDEYKRVVDSEEYYLFEKRAE